MKKAVVLLSGGIDSSTTAAIAKAEGHDIYALSFDYGQKHRRELESARMVAESLGVKKHLVIKFDLREIGGSALTTDIEVPKDRNELSPITNRPSIPITYVPARNTIFLSFALAWAEVLESVNIFIGANAVDYSGYPDCRPEYLKAFEDMANLATKASVEGHLRFNIRAPLLFMTKSEIIRKGTELGLDYSLTWSCYDPQPATAGVQNSKFKVQSFEENSSLVPCGRCDSCLFRAKGFKEAGLVDPLFLA
ncbi:MAG: 7-cyano-7-deazaguanine synthase QueC [Thermodesulfovibrionales bacterium]